VATNSGIIVSSVVCFLIILKEEIETS